MLGGGLGFRVQGLGVIVPLKWIEYGAFYWGCMRDNGQENGNYYNRIGYILRSGYKGEHMGIYRDL